MDIKHERTPVSPPASAPAPAFPVVGIGASAGGFPALATLLQHLPPSPGVAIVVILHLPARLPSSADRVLQGSTVLPVVQVSHTMPILPNQVYVIPPDRSLKMQDSHLMLDTLVRPFGDPVTIDIFFRTLAQAHQENAIGVVLSGMGMDGTAGLAHIKVHGGVTIAQLPAEAEAGSMPQSAIDSGMADFVLPAAQIPDKLIEIRAAGQAIKRRAREGNASASVPPIDMGPAPEQALHDMLTLLRNHTGHDFRQHRQLTLLRRLARRMQVRGTPDLPGYCRLMRTDSSEADALLKDLLIDVTMFSSDPATSARRDMAGAAETADPARHGRLFSYAEIHLHELARIGPASILVNARLEIVHMTETASPYLRHTAGEPTRDIVALALPELRLELHAALFRAKNSGGTVCTGPIRYAQDGVAGLVDITVIPFHDPHAGGPLMLVQLKKLDAPAEQGTHAGTPTAPLRPQPAEELTDTRRKLQETINQAETSGIEMRAANEALRTTVEEMRSKAMELDTSREELRSLNEELMIINKQLSSKVRETDSANADLQNLLSSTDIATLFLDSEMRIKRFTPRMRNIFNVIPGDIGRPLRHITHRLDYPHLVEEAATVFETLGPIEREVHSRDGADYIMRVHPCRTSEDRIDGVVMIFFDITARKAAEDGKRLARDSLLLMTAGDLRKSNARLHKIMNQAAAGVVETDEQGRMTLVNRTFCDMLGYTEAELLEKSVVDITDSGSVDETVKALRELAAGTAAVVLEKRYRRKDGSPMRAESSVSAMRGPDGRFQGLIAVVIDLSERRSARERWRRADPPK